MNTPGPIVTQGLTWALAQWNAFFLFLSTKVDATDGTAANLTITSGTAALSSLTVGGVPITGSGTSPANAYKDLTGTSYTTLATDGFIAVNSAAPVVITLVSAPPVGTTQTISDIAGLAVTANITVQPSAGTISGATNVILTQAYMSLGFTYTSNGWMIR